jgi:hypothetical protein
VKIGSAKPLAPRGSDVLTREWMGALALFILWGNTVLVALAALRNLGNLRALLRGGRVLDLSTLGPGEHPGLFRAELPPGKAFHLIEQVGRVGAGSTPSIVWHDRRASSRLVPSSARSGDREVGLTGPAAVWASEEALLSAARCADAAEFEQALVSAKKPRGFERPVEVPVSGDVWVVANVRIEDGAIVARGDEELPLVVATEDPRILVFKKTLVVLGMFLPAIFAVAAGCTFLAMTGKLFDGWMSKLGGVLCLLFFLLVLPAGTRLRDFLLPPHKSFLRGVWARPS